MIMEEAMFQELLESVAEGGNILRNETAPAREFSFSPPNVKAIRERMKLSQEKFAEVLGISLSTLRNWEQGRRYPDGPARVLLSVADRNPEVLWNLNISEKDEE